MSRRMAYRNIVVLGLVLAALAGAPARAATDVSYTIGSGVLGIGIDGGPDLLTLASADGGATYAPAKVIPAVGSYSTIPKTKWIDGSLAGGTAPVIRYRATFVVPPGTQPSLKVYVHADNAATVYVNGKKIGAQRQEALATNFQNPAESFSAKTSYIKVGENTVQINVANYGGPAGLNYLARVTLAKI